MSTAADAFRAPAPPRPSGDAMTANVEDTRRESLRRLGAPAPWYPSASSLPEAERKLASLQRRCRTRTLDDDDLAATMEVYLSALHLATELGWRVSGLTVESHCGESVPNSYSYRAESTWATVSSHGTPPGIRVARDTTPSRSHGRGTWRYRVALYIEGGCPETRPQLRGEKARKSGEGLAWWLP